MTLNKQWVTGLGGGVLALVFIVLFIAASMKKKVESEQVIQAKMEQQLSPRPVRFETVTWVKSEKNRVFPGMIKASDETALSFRVGGPLVEVNVTLGEPVKKGDLLMQIDPRDFEDRVCSLEAQLAGAEAVKQQTKQDYTRVSGLFEENVVPRSDYDHAKSAMDAAGANVKGITAQLQMAKHALIDTSLYAPYDGTVSEQLVENYEMVKSGNVVLHYHAIGWLQVMVNVPENEMVQYPEREGTDAMVSFPSVKNRSIPAHLKEWSTTADPLTRTYAVTFEFEAPADLRVLPGMSAQVALDAGLQQEAVLTVPVSALNPDPSGGNSVWVYSADTRATELRSVKVGALFGSSRVIIEDGIAAGEQVVVSGSRLIHGNQSLQAAKQK